MLKSFTIDWTQLFDLLLIPFCIQAAALAVGIFLNRMVNRKLQEKFAATPDNLQYIFVNALRGLPISLCSGIGLYWTITAIDMTPRVQTLLSNILLGVILFTITRVFARTLVGMIDMHTQSSDAHLPKTSLLTNIVYIAIYASGIMIILQSYGISVTPIITALGVGGMAVALGMQETLANIFAGLHLLLSKQLRLGDYIRLGTGEEGRVTDITWRFTTVQSVTNNVIVIPNQKIASAILTNYSMTHQEIAVSIPVGVSYDSDLEHVERVTLEVARAVLQEVEQTVTAEPVVRFHTLADSSINFNVTLRSSQFTNQYPLKHAFIKALIRRYREEGIEIPFPVRTLVHKNNAAS